MTMRVSVDGWREFERTAAVQPHGSMTCELPWVAPAETTTRVHLGIYWDGRYLGGLNQPLEAASVIGEFGRRVFMIEPRQPLTVAIPVVLAAGSRTAAQLQWELLAAGGGVHGHGTIPVDGREAVLRIEQLAPGRYELKLSMQWDAQSVATRCVPLYILESPFIDEPARQ